jgi:hypothetical protein
MESMHRKPLPGAAGAQIHIVYPDWGRYPSGDSKAFSQPYHRTIIGIFGAFLVVFLALLYVACWKLLREKKLESLKRWWPLFTSTIGMIMYAVCFSFKYFWTRRNRSTLV